MAKVKDLEMTCIGLLNFIPTEHLFFIKALLPYKTACKLVKYFFPVQIS